MNILWFEELTHKKRTHLTFIKAHCNLNFTSVLLRFLSEH
jgi:hypothetical protein